jgi:uncharacterized damage-inducible protein DinB
MNADLELFYGLTTRTRSHVLEWLGTLPNEIFTAQREDFAYGSLSAIYSHIADCYLHWIGKVGFGGFTHERTVSNVSELRDYFARVDEAVLRAVHTFEDWDEPFSYTSSSGRTGVFTRRWLVLHPITHEFHHKGQALALARVLGHPHPGMPDSDLVTPGEPPRSN